MSEERRGYDLGPVVLGVDPGKKTGFAVFDGRRLCAVGSGAFFDVQEQLRCWVETREVVRALVEDNRRLPIYASHDKVHGRRRDALCRNVGRIDRDVELWLDWFEALGVEAQGVVPVRAKKWSAEQLRRLTGWRGASNQHGRDAARLVWGRRVLGGLFVGAG